MFEKKKAKTTTASPAPTISNTQQKKAKQDSTEEIVSEFEWYVGAGKKSRYV